MWLPQERIGAASALRLPFFAPPPLALSVAAQQGKHGLGSIASGHLQADVLDYIQNDPGWLEMRAEAERTHFSPNRCMSAAEGALGLKAEFPGYVDASRPPPTCRLNGDRGLKPIAPRRCAQFGKAVRRRATPWLNQLTARIRAAIRVRKLPVHAMANGAVFVDEELADLAWVYASVQVLKVGARSDGWHTDGGASLLHAGLTVFGKRALEVELAGQQSCISLPQQPGSFYIGNLCALNHNACHIEDSPGCLGEGPDRAQIAVMFRTDVFRDSRARGVFRGSLYQVVNNETAKHLAEVPFYLPDLSEVLAESAD